MKRKTKNMPIGMPIVIDIDYSHGYFPINEVISLLTEAANREATTIEIKAEIYSGEIDEVIIQPIKIETESDEDFAKRQAEEESRRLAAENVEKAREKALYESLKSKYENYEESKIR